MSNLQDWSKQFQQFQQINLQQNKNNNKRKQNDEWSTYRQSTASNSGWGNRQRDPVKELSDIAECRKRGSSDLDHWRFKESKSRFKSGAPGSSTSSMSGTFSKAEKKSSPIKWIVIAIVIIVLLNVGVSLIGTLFRAFADELQGITYVLNWDSESQPEASDAPSISIAEEVVDVSSERDADSVFTLKNVTGMNDQQASDFMDIFETCTMGVLWDMIAMPDLDENGLTCYAVYPLWEDGWDEDTDMLVWLDENLAISRLEFLGNLLYDVEQGVITDTTQILYVHDDLQVDTISWGAKDGGGFVSGVITQTSSRDYVYVAPVVAFYDEKSGEFLDAYYVEAKRDGEGTWIFSTAITDTTTLPWNHMEVQVEGILAYE